MSHRFIMVFWKAEVNAGKNASVGTSDCTNTAAIMYFVEQATLSILRASYRIRFQFPFVPRLTFWDGHYLAEITRFLATDNGQQATDDFEVSLQNGKLLETMRLPLAGFSVSLMVGI
ncbi:MAG: hypothetical protein ACLFVT_00820 [Syntrophobacteria bacterium]